MRSALRSMFAILAASLLAPPAGAPAVPGKPDDAVLARMDQAAAAFKSLTAKLKRITYTAVINDTLEEYGTLMLLRDAKSIRLRVDYDRPDVKSQAVHDKMFEEFIPKLNTVREYDLGRDSQLVDQFLLLGFGTSGNDLARSYSVKFLGQETLGGQTVARLNLVPKSKKALNYIKSIDLWYLESGGYPVQQKFYQPSGDYNLVSYFEVKVNPGLTPDALKLHLPVNIRREKLQ